MPIEAKIDLLYYQYEKVEVDFVNNSKEMKMILALMEML